MWHYKTTSIGKPNNVECNVNTFYGWLLVIFLWDNHHLQLPHYHPSPRLHLPHSYHPKIQSINWIPLDINRFLIYAKKDHSLYALFCLFINKTNIRLLYTYNLQFGLLINVLTRKLTKSGRAPLRVVFLAERTDAQSVSG
jgi:hypothetical protein